MAAQIKLARTAFVGQLAVNGHITITDNCHFHGGSIVTKPIKEAGAYASITPLMDIKSFYTSDR